MTSLPRVTPGHGLSAAAWQVWATLRAEVLMQWRRWGFWVTFTCFCALLLLLTVQGALYFSHLPADSLYVQEHFSREELENAMTYGTTGYGVMFFGLMAALLVVDRVDRDQRLGVAELQRAAPQGCARYVLGKFAGNYLAVLAPALGTYVLCALLAMLLGWSALLVKVLLAFALVLVPSSLAAVGLTLLLASCLPVRVVQIGFTLLWVYVSIGIGWHGLAETPFNTSGLYVYPVFFPNRLPSIAGTPAPSLSLALFNIAVLVLTALLSLGLMYGALSVQRARAEGA
jgi:hypothetical protein